MQTINSCLSFSRARVLSLSLSLSRSRLLMLLRAFLRFLLPFPLGMPWDRNTVVCKLENVCWHQGEIEYYLELEHDMDEDFFNPNVIFGRGLVATTDAEAKMHAVHGQGYAVRYSPRIKAHPRRDASYSPYAVHLLDFMGMGYNFGHFLIGGTLGGASMYINSLII
jgi:hypothetical protein